MLILLLAVFLGLLTIRFQRIFMEYAVNVCEDSAIKEINTLMEDEVFSHPDEFADLVVLERDSDNRITALRTDIIAVGKVKARIVNGLFDRLDYLEETQTEVPLGTVFAPNLFTGMGPRVKVGLAGLAQMEAQFVSAFTSAGINQTLHQVMVTVNTRVAAILPLYTVETDVSTDICIAETVIVGEVPQSFTDISGDNRGLIDKVNDYGLKNVD